MMNFKVENGGITILDENNVAIAEIWRRGNTEKELQYAHLFSNAYNAFAENEALQKKTECLQHKLICLQKQVKKLKYKIKILEEDVVSARDVVLMAYNEQELLCTENNKLRDAIVKMAVS